jgi:O-antigen/teichoic acid export membrane protein
MKLNRGAAVLALGDICGKVIGFLLLPYMTMRMDVAEYGVLSLYLAVIQILTIVFSFCGNGLLPIKYAQDGAHAALFYRGILLRLSAAMLLLSFVVAGFVDLLSIFDMGDRYVYMLVCVVAALQGINAINLSYLRSNHEFGIAAFGQFFASILSVGLTIAVFEFYRAGAPERLLSTALSFLVVQLVYQYFAKEFGASSSVSIAKMLTELRSKSVEVVSYGGSLFMHHASFWIKSYLDRFVILGYLSVSQVGIYSLAMQLNSIVVLVFTVISQACQPFTYKYLAEKDWPAFRRMRHFYILAVGGFSLAFFLFFKLFYVLIFDSKYEESLGLFNVLLLGSVSHSVYFIFSQSIFFLRKNSVISGISLLSMLLHMLALAVVAGYGVNLKYMAYVYVLSSLFSCAATVCYAKKIEKELE